MALMRRCARAGCGAGSRRCARGCLRRAPCGASAGRGDIRNALRAGGARHAPCIPMRHGGSVSSDRLMLCARGSARRCEAPMNPRETCLAACGREPAHVADGRRREACGYLARNINALGALLSEGPALTVGRELKVMLPLSGRDLVLHARVLRASRTPRRRPRGGRFSRCADLRAGPDPGPRGAAREARRRQSGQRALAVAFA